MFKELVLKMMGILPSGESSQAKLNSNSELIVQLNSSTLSTTLNTTALNQLIVDSYNSIDIGYDVDGNVSTVTYKQNGVTVSTLTLTYTDGNLTSVSRVDA